MAPGMWPFLYSVIDLVSTTITFLVDSLILRKKSFAVIIRFSIIFHSEW